MAGTKIAGIAAAEAIDTSAEKISIEGLDISSIEDGYGLVNYEHKNPKQDGASAQDLLGAITYAHKVFSEKDCENDRQRDFWKSIELPFLYIEAELFDDEEPGHDGAKAMASLINFYKKRNLPIVARFSIDGSTLKRNDKNPNLLEQTIGRHVALTVQPCNHSCITDVIVPKTELEKRTDIDDPSRFTTGGLYRMPGVNFEMKLIEDEAPASFQAEELEKAMAAGNYNVAPSQLSGGAALQSTDFASEKKQFVNKVRGSLRDWDRKRSLKTHLEKTVPEATQNFVDRFCDLVDHFRLKKTAELHGQLESVIKGLKGQELEAAIANLPWIGAGNEDLRRDPATPNTEIGGRSTKIEGAPKKAPGTGTQIGTIPKNNQTPSLYTQFTNKFAPQATTPSWTENKPAYDVEGQKSKLKAEGWQMEHTPTGWSATAPRVAKSEVTAFFQPQTESLHLPSGIFQVHTRDPEAHDKFNSVAASPSIKMFHDRAMAGWRKLNDALRQGKLPDSVIRLASYVAQTPTEVPSFLQEWVGDLAQLENRQPVDESKVHALKLAADTFRANAKSFMSANQQHPFAVSTPNAQYAMMVMGLGDVVPQDDHLLRDMFALESGDSSKLEKLKEALNTNPTVWDDVVRFYGNTHDALKHIAQNSPHKDHFEKFPNDALIHGSTIHWLTVPGKGDSEKLIDSELNKSESDTYIQMFDRWMRKYGPHMAILLYYTYLAPKMLAEPLAKGDLIDFQQKKQNQEMKKDPLYSNFEAAKQGKRTPIEHQLDEEAQVAHDKLVAPTLSLRNSKHFYDYSHLLTPEMRERGLVLGVEHDGGHDSQQTSMLFNRNTGLHYGNSLAGYPQMMLSGKNDIEKAFMAHAQRRKMRPISGGK